MKGVQCYELFGGIALKIHTFSFFFHVLIESLSCFVFVFCCLYNIVLSFMLCSMLFNFCVSMYVYIFIHICTCVCVSCHNVLLYPSETYHLFLSFPLCCHHPNALEERPINFCKQ